MNTNRYYTARTKYNKHGFQPIQDVYKNTGIAKSLLSDLEAEKDRGVSYKKIKDLAEYYGVSVDWLLGLSDVHSLSPDIKSAVKTTGLTEDAISTLIHYSGSRIPALISMICSSDDASLEDLCDWVYKAIDAMHSVNQISDDYMTTGEEEEACNDLLKKRGYKGYVAMTYDQVARVAIEAAVSDFRNILSASIYAAAEDDGFNSQL